MNILSVAIDSTSIRYGVYDSGKEILKDKVSYFVDEDSENRSIAQAFRTINDSVKKSKVDIKVVVHKLLHSGICQSPCMADKRAMEELEKLSDFPLLYNPDQVEMIDLCSKAFSGAKQVICFDNGLFKEMDSSATVYAIDPTVAATYRIKRYGYDSINHLNAGVYACDLLKKKFKQEKIISVYLGENSSICAIQNGEGADVTSGFTKLEGIPGFNSSGGVDPTVLTLLMDEELHTTDEILNILKAQSGLSALSEIEKFGDFLKSKDKKAKFALSVLQRSAIKGVGSMACVLNGPTIIVFSGDLIHQNSSLRDEICANLEFMGVKIDKKKNSKNEEIISDAKSDVKVLNISENELLMMAKMAMRLLKK